MKKLFFLLIIFPALLWSKVDPPNYNFSLDSLKPFMPGGSKDALDKKFGKGVFIEESKGTKTFKYYVAHIRYKFPVFVQFYQNKSVDFFARLPSYFLHDVFHQSLINRYGKQNEYFKRENSAIYVWNNVKGSRLYYSGQCTITCFPMYYSAYLIDIPAGLGGFKPLVQKFSTSSEEK